MDESSPRSDARALGFPLAVVRLLLRPAIVLLLLPPVPVVPVALQLPTLANDMTGQYLGI
jgi:hypothetical protein